MFNVLPQILIFVSLAVIIYIVGKKIPRLRELSHQMPKEAKLDAQRKGNAGGFFQRILGFFGKIFIAGAEWIVKKIKNLLHLVHFWLIKVKQGKRENEELGEIEAKQELIREEEKNLEKIINENLPSQGDSIEQSMKIKKEGQADYMEEFEADTEEEISAGGKYPPQEKKIEQFFSQETEQEQEPVVSEEEQPRAGFFKKLFNRKKEAQDPTWKAGLMGGTDPHGGINQEMLNDGIKRAEENPYFETEARLMKEVVKVKRRPEETDQDEELGVDRQILEKKIIQKIAKNPRDIENYRQLGELYIKMKNFLDAEESYKQILKIIPRDIDAKRKLEKIKLLKRLQ